MRGLNVLLLLSSLTESGCALRVGSAVGAVLTRRRELVPQTRQYGKRIVEIGSGFSTRFLFPTVRFFHLTVFPLLLGSGSKLDHPTDCVTLDGFFLQRSRLFFGDAHHLSPERLDVVNEPLRHRIVGGIPQMLGQSGQTIILRVVPVNVGVLLERERSKRLGLIRRERLEDRQHLLDRPRLGRSELDLFGQIVRRLHRLERIPDDLAEHFVPTIAEPPRD